MKGQLGGIRVIDMSRVFAGPLAGQMLGDLGAEVIKIERPKIGDEARYYGPPFFDGAASRSELESALFLSANRNKKSVTIDFTTREGQDVLTGLIAKSDVVIENYRPGTLDKYGLDYASIRRLNPRIVYCSITGYGQTGPHSARSGYDAVFQAEGGLMQSIGYPDDHPAGGPLRVGLSIVDIVTSLYSDIAILAALYRRDARGGEGEWIDMSLLECCVGAMSHHAMHYLISGEVPKRRGNFATGGGVPSGVFRCATDEIMITIGNDAQFQKLCVILDRPDLATDPRFVTSKERVKHRDLVTQEIADSLRQKPADEWIEAMIKADLAVGRINTLEKVFEHPQIRHRGVRVDMEHRSGKKLSVVGNPVHFKEAPVSDYRRPPGIGEHTDEVLEQVLELDAAAIAALKAAGAV